MSEGIWAFIGACLGAVFSGLISNWQQEKKFKQDKEMFRRQNLSEEIVKEHLEDVLNHKEFVIRSFDTLKKRALGYSDDEVRKLLHAIAAKPSKMESGKEGWYLSSRTGELVQRKGTTKTEG